MGFWGGDTLSLGGAGALEEIFQGGAGGAFKMLFFKKVFFFMRNIRKFAPPPPKKKGRGGGGRVVRTLRPTPSYAPGVVLWIQYAYVADRTC